MRVIISMITGVAALGLASGVGAQEKKAAPRKEPAPRKAPAPRGERCFNDRDRVDCRVWFGDSARTLFSRANLDSALMKRPALGVELTGTGSLRDTIGLFVARVTPKGPAENAGVVEGDRIVSINGIDLRVNPADAGDSYASGLPARRLSREVNKLAPGNAVNLRVYSGGRIRDVRVTLGRAYDVREPGAFGALFDRVGNGFNLRNMENMYVPFERLRDMDFPRMHIEQMQVPRVRIERMNPGRMRLEELERLPLRIEGIPGLRDGGTRVRVLSPSRIRTLSPTRTYLLDEDELYPLDEDTSEKKAKKK